MKAPLTIFMFAMTALMPLAIMVSLPGTAAPAMPERVTFSSADGHTTLVGYVFKPAQPLGPPSPAIVMMHGRAGAYSSAAHGVYDAETLSKRHQEWGHLWAEQGYLAILVDGFGPRGYPQGFPRFSYDQRPPELNEVTVRPLDAYGALAYLRRRNDVAGNRVAIQGWSNGGSATLATMSATAPGILSPTPKSGFEGGLVLYPACGLKDQFQEGILLYAPVRVFQGSADEEVSPHRCQELVNKSQKLGSDMTFTLYPGATHDFDDPGAERQSVPANAAARQDVMTRAREFLAVVLK